MNEAADFPEWKQFEIAVADFLRALDPNAKVTHDAKIEDVHTGKPRQRDVWIEAVICQLFQIKILVSCKFWDARVSQQDIDAFNGEFISSGAHKGVIYSKTGFTDEAIVKANALDFSCCRLYANQPPDIPEMLVISGYCSRNQAFVGLQGPFDPSWASKTWNDLFGIDVVHDGQQMPAIDAIAQIHDAAVKESVFGINLQQVFPQPWSRSIDLHPATDSGPILRFVIGGRWQTWIAKTEAYFLNGTYSITDKRFIGSQGTPFIDTWNFNPGPGWTPIEKPELGPRAMCHMIIQGKTKESLLAHMASLSIIPSEGGGSDGNRAANLDGPAR